MPETLKICSVGDLMLCDSPLYVSVGVGTAYPSIRSALIESCRRQFADADVVIGNFETVVHRPENRSLAQRQMACPETVIGDLREAGFTVLNLANNHCLQHGTEGFENTWKACEQVGIEPIGRRDQEPCILEIKGRKLAFLSLCIHLEWYQPDKILYEDRIGKIAADIRELHAGDPTMLIVVSVHWGDEYAQYPSNAQIALGHKLVSWGADLVLGHHSHVFQGVETHQGGVIAYSQGNFVADMSAKMCRQTGVLFFEIGEGGIEYRMAPAWIGEEYIPKKAAGTWYDDRVALLRAALNGEKDDNRYWEDIRRNHAAGHNAFKSFFKKNVLRYETAVSSRMILEFVGRKVRRMAGISTDGRVSSMDGLIYESLAETEKIADRSRIQE